MSWSIHPAFVLRMAGFPLAWLERLAMPAACRAAEDALDAEDAARREMSALVAALDGLDWRSLDRETAGRLGRTRRAIENDLRNDLERLDLDVVDARGLAADETLASARAALDRLAGARQVAARRYAEELETTSRALRTTVSEPRVQQAIAHLSPAVLRNTVGALLREERKRCSKTRERERVVVTYLQRLCAKNETNSFFGPTATGRLRETDGLSCSFLVPVIGRRVYVAHWAAQALADAVLRDVPALDCPRPSPTLRLEGDVASFVRNDERLDSCVSRRYVKGRLGAVERRVIAAAVDGKRTRTALAAASTAEGGEGVEALLDEMTAAGLLTAGLRVPSGHLDPLRWLDRVLADLHGDDGASRWRAHLAELAAAIQAYADAAEPDRLELFPGIEALFERLTGVAAHRGAGQHYADRAIVSEECIAGASDLAVDSRAFDEAAGAFDLLFDLVALPLLSWRAAVRTWFRRRFDRHAPVPFVELERRLLVEMDAIAALRRETPVEQSLERVREVIGAAIATGGAVVALPIDRLAAALEPSHLVDGLARHHSLDVVPFADGDRLRLLVGEVHAFFWIQEVLYAHLPEAEWLSAERHELIRRCLDGLPGAEVVFRHTTKVDLRSPTSLDYELLVDGEPLLPRERVVPIAEVVVALDDDDTFRFSAPRVGAFAPVAVGALPKAFQLLPSIYPASAKDDGYFPDELLPADQPATMPRLELGPLVLRRRTWRLPAAALRALRNATSLVEAQRLRRQHGLPARLFCRAPGQPKPVLLDLRSQHLIEVTAHQLGQHDGMVTLSEMLPDEEQLVLQGPDGRRTCEMRMAAWRWADGR